MLLKIAVPENFDITEANRAIKVIKWWKIRK